MPRKSQQPESDGTRDAQLIERSVAGDGLAFAELYAAYFSRIYTVCLKRVGDASDAEDLAQETFVQFYRSLASFEGRSSLSTWAFGIARNVCAWHFRQRARCAVSLRDAREPDDRPMAAMTERRIDAQRVLVRLDAVLDAASRPAHREIFRLRYSEWRSIRSIAQEVGKSDEAVKVSLRRSRSALLNGIPELRSVLDGAARRV